MEAYRMKLKEYKEKESRLKEKIMKKQAMLQIISVYFESDDDDDIEQLLLSSSSSDDSNEDNPMLNGLANLGELVLKKKLRMKRCKVRVASRYSSEEFKSHFRMYPETFEFVLQLIGETLSIAARDRKPISAEKQLLLAIWIMATPGSLRSACENFNVDRETAIKSLRRVTNALQGLASRFIQWPKGETAQEVMNQFEQISAFPKVIGAIDGIHIKIEVPVHVVRTYGERKSEHSIQVQAVCTQNLMFTSVFADNAGCVHDARVFRLSPVQQYIEALEEYFPSDSHIVGDAAYGIHPCIMTPFGDDGHLTARQKNFNFCLSSARMSIEKAIELWKGRWQRVLACSPIIKIEKIPEFLLATCVLHNICILKQDLISFQEAVRVRKRGRLIEDNELQGSSKRNQIMDTLKLRDNSF